MYKRIIYIDDGQLKTGSLLNENDEDQKPWVPLMPHEGSNTNTMIDTTRDSGKGRTSVAGVLRKMRETLRLAV